MKPEGPSNSPGVRLATDLSKIRKAREVSIEDIHEETKVPLGLIEQFEVTALLDHDMFNEVYLRSFVRGYAQVVEIDVELAMASLEAVFEGHYDGVLAVKYLGAKPEPAQAAPPPPKPVPPPPKPKPPPPVMASARQAAEQKKAAQKKGKPKPATPAKAAATAAAGTAAGGAGDAAKKKTSSAPPWLRKGRKRLSRGRAGLPVLPILIGGSLVVLLGLAGYWFFLREPSTAAPAPPPSDPTVQADTVAAPVPVREPIALAPTMVFWVVAANGPVQEIRIKNDDDLRRPYWIEQGDSLRFEATNRISFEQQLSKIRLTLQGYRVPIPDPNAVIVFDRQTAQAFLDRQ